MSSYADSPGTISVTLPDAASGKSKFKRRLLPEQSWRWKKAPTMQSIAGALLSRGDWI